MFPIQNQRASDGDGWGKSTPMNIGQNEDLLASTDGSHTNRTDLRIYGSENTKNVYKYCTAYVFTLTLYVHGL